MKKELSALIACALLAPSFPPAFLTPPPAPAAAVLTVEQDGGPASGTEVSLYRLDPGAGTESLVGSFETGEDGTVTASHLTTGLYCWVRGDGEKHGFRIAGAGFVRTEIELPPTVTVTVPVYEDTEFGAAQIGLSLEGFAEAGFDLGDSVDIVFGNGYALADVPVYNGYNARTGMPLVCCYPGYARPSVCFCNGEGMWKIAGLKEGDTVTVTLREKAKYADVQEAMNLVYSNDIADYDDPETFANFRPMKGGALKEGKFWRGASPVNNTMNRAAAVDGLIRDAGVGFVLDLADTEAKLDSFRAKEDFASPYFMSLYEAGNVALLGLNAAFRSPGFMEKLAGGLCEMIKHDGPVYIHCLEGKDRTGFVCALLEALAGADYDELLADYTATYANFYGVTAETDPAKYGAILDVKFTDIVALITGLPDGSDYGGDVLRDSAAAYLSECGMTEEEIAELAEYLCE